ncbi:MAG: cyclic pyranopterin monophosphate synthase MoaC [Deltaproteobacteria bacterium]|nr:cyclic pyranopterin monophosphate synthase MoaC [Deltaproteobacteria bacterium]
MVEPSHVDARGRARMVDVGDKDASVRRAVASARLSTRPEVVDAIASGRVAKGDVFAAARLAGILAAKRCAELIPLCHPLPLDHVEVDLEGSGSRVEIRAAVRCTGRTGVEMEALCAASVAALTIYDMCKSLDRGMCIERVRLEEKSGGKSGHYRAPPEDAR